MQDDYQKAVSNLTVVELEEALEQLGQIPDVPTMHSAFTEFLRELGFPEDLVGIEVLEFRRELTHESDRGAALFAAAHLDEGLAAMLKGFLVEDDAIAATLFAGTAALATFSARIDMAYLLGLLPASVRRELHLIRKIRNEFAHGTKMLRFNDPSVTSRCRELTRASFAVEPRSRFIQAAMGIGGIIEANTRLLAAGRKNRCRPAEELAPANPATIRKALVLLADALKSQALGPAEDATVQSTCE